MNRTEPIQRAAAHDETTHQTRTNKQIRIQTHDTLRQHQILLSLPDQLMCHHDIASVDRKAAQRDMRTVGDRLNNFCNRLHLVGHGPWSRWTRVFWKGEEAIRTETRTQADLLTPNQSITVGVASGPEKSSACEREFPQMEVQSARHDSFSWPPPC